MITQNRQITDPGLTPNQDRVLMVTFFHDDFREYCGWRQLVMAGVGSDNTLWVIPCQVVPAHFINQLDESSGLIAFVFDRRVFINMRAIAEACTDQDIRKELEEFIDTTLDYLHPTKVGRPLSVPVSLLTLKEIDQNFICF